MSNKQQGNAFERELAKILAEHGFWVHILAQNQAGQPFDIIAARKGYTWPIDCKVCMNDYFRLERVEDNQAKAMALWRFRGNRECWFALKLSNGTIYMIAYRTIRYYKEINKIHTLTSDMIKRDGFTLEEWMGIS